LKIYDLSHIGRGQAQQLLSTTIPGVGFPSTDGGKTVVVWARQQDHERIAATIAELGKSQAFQDDRTVQLYSIRDLGPNIIGIVSTLVPGVQVVAGPQLDEMTVTARPEDQQKIAELIERLKSDSRPRLRTLASYDIGRADPDSVRQIVQSFNDAETQFSVDPRGRRLLVRTYTDKLDEVEAIVRGIAQPHGSDESLSTRTYQLNQGEADEAQEVLQALMPSVTLVTDNDKKVLAATATTEQHQLIESVVNDMRRAFGSDGASQPATYPLLTADPDSILLMLRNLFARSPEVSLSIDRPTRTLVAVARPDQQETIRTLIEQIDQAGDASRQRTVQVYPMRGTDSGTAVAIVRTLLEGIDPEAKVAYNPQSRQVVVTTRADGHARVEEMTAQLGTPGERDVEVFQLERMEPLTARLAVDGLFNDGRTDPADRPSIQTNEETQQLIVRGTTEQIEQIREVLVKMGEVALTDRGGTSRNVRVIPIDGDFDRALPRIEELWPRFRKNPLRILRPGDQGTRDAQPLRPSGNVPDPSTSLPKKGGVPQELLQATQLVAFEAASVESPQSQPQDESLEGTTEPQASGAVDPDIAAPQQESPPVVIIPGPDRVTIASEDAEALNQMESLLRSLFLKRDAVRGRDFTVYALQNAGAVTVADTLNEFFRRNSPVSTGSVMVVPDYRLNALIVYAGRADREKIESLIQTLDSENIPDSLASFQTRIVPVNHADAAAIARTLQGIYRSQMTAGGARQSVSIPEGVPSSIASVLRQINAAASSPLLTVEVDRATNSLVLMAPNNLLDEVSELITRLDESAAVSQARQLRI
ncbi:MAG: hypothetical protein KF861_22050, partial [Planctomycetaceae bacterium]|nr:hypothetical protein [Planctomycetaceae bacterium]